MSSAGRRTSACAAAIYLIFTSVLLAQTEFQNLDFEDANVTDLPPNQNEFVAVEDGLLGWLAYIDTNQLTQVGHNWITLDSPNVAIFGPQYVGSWVSLEGAYSAILQPGDSPHEASIVQTGLIPAWAKSLQFKASSTNYLDVSVGGLSRPFAPLGSNNYGCDISAFAGSIEEIRFRVGGVQWNALIFLDAITFSAQFAPTVAVFSGSPTTGWAPLPVTFTDASCGSITNRFWDFGDGNTTNTTATNLKHIYSTGVYTVSLIVSGLAGSNTNTQSNYIVATNSPPPCSTVVGWGGNNFGQATTPAGLTGVVAIAANGWHSLALTSDGTVVGWGDNRYGQSTPPAGLTGVVAIAAGGTHSLALRSDGTVVGWGLNDNGQATTPAGLTGVVAIAAGDYHSLVLKSDGTVVGWGSQAWSIQPDGLTGVVAIAAGGTHSLVLKSDGTVVNWGGDTPPAGLTGVVAIAAGDYKDLALKSDGTIVGWGGNTPPAGLTGAVAIAASGGYDLALMSDGAIVGWGGDTPPVQLTGVVAIAAGYYHGLALTSPCSGLPSALTATAVSTSQIDLSWTDNFSNEDRFGIERATSFTGPWNEIGSVNSNVTMYSDTGANCGQTYCYRVRSYNAAVGSPYSNIANANTSPNDTDCDGLPNSWTQQYFGHLTGQASDKSRAQDDPDGDGMSNLQEYLAGTDPTNSASVFRIIGITAEGDDLRVTWTMGSGKTNALQVAPTAEDGGYYTNDFADIFTVINTAGSATNYLDVGAGTNAPGRFYRVRLVP